MIHGGELRAMQLVAEKKPESSLDGFFTKFARSAPVLFRRIFSTYAIVGAGMHPLADESDSLEKKTTFISRFV